MSGRNIGDLLNEQGITWGWFNGGFRTPDGLPACTATHTGSNGLPVADYVPHHAPFQYYPSTANPNHVGPSAVEAIGRTGGCRGSGISRSTGAQAASGTCSTSPTTGRDGTCSSIPIPVNASMGTTSTSGCHGQGGGDGMPSRLLFVTSPLRPEAAHFTPGGGSM
jgi:hypothetical protein